MGTHLHTIVYADPAPKGSLKCIGRRGRRAHVLIDDNPRTDRFRARVSGALALADPLPAASPVIVDLLFTLPRPASHYRTGRHADQLRDDAPHWPVKRSSGDLDKLVRAVLDAMQDGHNAVLPDDSQIIGIHTAKRYVCDKMPEPGLRLNAEVAE